MGEKVPGLRASLRVVLDAAQGSRGLGRAGRDFDFKPAGRDQGAGRPRRRARQSARGGEEGEKEAAGGGHYRIQNSREMYTSIWCFQ
jgi:hypothetical protein